MTFRNALEVEMLTLAAAYLRSKDMLQAKIAGILKISQPEVSRLLARAKKKKWLKFQPPDFELPGDLEEMWDRAKARYFSADQLLAALKQREPAGVARLKKIAILHGAPAGEFNRTVIPPIQEVLAAAAILGVTWGGMVSALISYLADHLPQPLPDGVGPVRFVPLCGEPFKDQDGRLEHSSTALASRLHRIVNGGKGDAPPSLRGIAAFLPLRFKEAETRTIERFIRQFIGYASVFGSEKGDKAAPLYKQVDTVLTSVGVAGLALRRGIFLKERIKLGDITEPELTATVVGDIGGIIIPRRAVTAAQGKKIAALNERWTGYKLGDLEACAEAAATSDRPGVVVLATDPAKRDMIVRIVELGLVNELILSSELAHDLDEALEEGGAGL